MNMKKTAIVALIFTAAIVCGCDFFRSLAGRPTSAEIDGKRTAIELAEREREQTRLDSIRVAEKIVSDSLSAVSRIDSLGVAVISLSDLGGAEQMIPAGYVIVVGSFKSAGNADRMAQSVTSAGYSPLVLTFRNGMAAVAVEPCHRISDAVAAYEKVGNEKFCPKDAWILRNN